MFFPCSDLINQQMVQLNYFYFNSNNGLFSDKFWHLVSVYVITFWAGICLKKINCFLYGANVVNEIIAADISRNKRFFNSICCFHSHFLISRLCFLKYICFSILLKIYYLLCKKRETITCREEKSKLAQPPPPSPPISNALS